MNTAIKLQKKQSKAANPKALVETAQMIDGEVSYVMQEKDILRINKELVQNYINTV